MRILAIETSCDETSIAIIDVSGSRKKPKLRALSHIISSQLKLHAKFGGVVPNLAKREHQRNLVPILLTALGEARLRNYKLQITNYKQIPNSKIRDLKTVLKREPDLFARIVEDVTPLSPPKIDAIAVTHGPGLAPALWVGVNFAKALSFLWKKPLFAVNHMEGHVYSAFLRKSGGNSKFEIRNSKFPVIALLVSGGHTELVLMRGHGKYKIIGETLDDAAGEAFDKVARMLGLGYPGGPRVAALAQHAQKHADKMLNNAKFLPHISASSPRKSARELQLPRPMINSKDYNFSFSGLKTAALYLINDLTKKHPLAKIRPAIAREFQDAVVEVLVTKTLRAAKAYKVKSVLLGGGVAANTLLRKTLANKLSRELPRVSFLISPLALTGDNALMIALAAFFAGKKKAPNAIGAHANARLGR